MIVYKLEFKFFCGVSWSNKTIYITAINKFQLIRVFLIETLYYKGRKTIKELWRENEKYIEITTLTFPIVTERDF